VAWRSFSARPSVIGVDMSPDGADGDQPDQRIGES